MLPALLAAGCIDLADPVIPNRGASAVLSITLRQIPGQEFDVTGTLSPGKDSIGVPHPVLTPMVVLGQVVPFGTLTAQGIYVISKPFDASADTIGPFDIQPPIIYQTNTPASFRWYGMRRLDPDTVSVDALGDVSLHVQTKFGAVTPPPQAQWFLELRGDNGSIRVSGDGPPPDTLRIPSQFLPPALSKRVYATLIYYQSAVLVGQPVNYIESVTLDIRRNWVVKTR